MGAKMWMALHQPCRPTINELGAKNRGIRAKSCPIAAHGVKDGLKFSAAAGGYHSTIL